MSETAGRADAASGSGDAAARVREAAAARADARDAVADVGEERLRALRDAIEDVRRLFRQYEEKATGTGDFESYVAFQDDIVALVEDLDDDLPEYETFDWLLDHFKQRRLSTSDFDRARSRLADAEERTAPLDDLADAEAEFRDAVAAARERRDALRDRVAHLERVTELGDADLDAPVEDLRAPLDAYNDAVRDAFDAFVADAPAHEVVAFLDRAEAFPLVPFRSAPADLASYVREHDVGEKPVPRLLELADFSRSKLDHFVDDPASFTRVVAGNQTFLDRLDADPLTLDWPPATAAVLRCRADELVSLVGRIADGAPLVRLHEVRALARSDRYERIRDAAVARHELTEDDRERLRRGDVERELAAAREEKDRVEAALDEYA